MSITNLRQNIHVLSHSGGSTCTTKIEYIFLKPPLKRMTLTISVSELKGKLFSINSIDDDITDEEYITYRVSQWDALNLAIRHELEKETEKEMNNSDIGKAIKNITK